MSLGMLGFEVQGCDGCQDQGLVQPHNSLDVVQEAALVDVTPKPIHRSPSVHSSPLPLLHPVNVLALVRVPRLVEVGALTLQQRA